MFDKEWTERCLSHARATFKEFEAVYKEYDNITLIDWRNRNGSEKWAIRYILDGTRLIISGDIGSAIFETLYSPFDIDFCSKATEKIDYLAEKCVADGTDRSLKGIYEWDETYLKQDLKKQLQEWFSDLSAPKDLAELKDISWDLVMSRRPNGSLLVTMDIEYRLRTLADDYWDSDCAACLEDCGMQYSLFYISWLAGLEMACKKILSVSR